MFYKIKYDTGNSIGEIEVELGFEINSAETMEKACEIVEKEVGTRINIILATPTLGLPE